MQKFIVFAIMTGLFWGFYGTPLAKARDQIGPKWPYLGIMVGYIIVCTTMVIIPMIAKGELTVSGKWLPGLSWGTVAGILGAGGAYTLTLAMISGGGKYPYIVMVVVFGTAVSVAAIVGIIQTRHEHPDISPWLYVFLVGIIACVIGVTSLTPHAHKKPPVPEQVVDIQPSQ